jgi:hypothetical protein
MVGLDLDRVLDLQHRHLGAAAQELGQMALLGRVEMGCDDEGEAAVGRHRAKQRLKRFQPARGRADADDRKLGHATPAILTPTGRRSFHRTFMLALVPSACGRLDYRAWRLESVFGRLSRISGA